MSQRVKTGATANNPLPPTTTTIAPRQQTTTAAAAATVDDYIHILCKNTRLGRIFLVSFAQLPHCFPPFHAVPLHPPPSGSPTTTYFSHRTALFQTMRCKSRLYFPWRWIPHCCICVDVSLPPMLKIPARVTPRYMLQYFIPSICGAFK